MKAKLPKVLFVDDQAEVLDALKVQVNEICVPHFAQDAEVGLEIFEKKGPFTIVVSDQILPCLLYTSPSPRD